jgi:hypothetical protein
MTAGVAIVMAQTTWVAKVAFVRAAPGEFDMAASEIFLPDGEPTAQEIADFIDHGRVMRFTTDRTIAVQACDNLGPCGAAMDFACSVLNSIGRRAAWENSACRGDCVDGTRVRIRCVEE